MNVSLGDNDNDKKAAGRMKNLHPELKLYPRWNDTRETYTGWAKKRGHPVM